MTSTDPPDAMQQIHPGDLVQIVDQLHDYTRAILMVTETHSWGIGATMSALQPGRLVESYHRLRPEQVRVVGAAYLLPPDVLDRRKASVATAQEVAREADHG